MFERLAKFKEGLLTGFKTGGRGEKGEYDDDYDERDYDEDDERDYDEDDEGDEKSREVYIPESGKRDRRTYQKRPASYSKGYSRAVEMSTSDMQIIISHPQTVEEAGSICDCVKSDKVVIVNLEGVKHESAQRIVDFLGGVAYALDGDIQSITNKTLVLAPSNVDISGHFKEELKASGVLFSFKSSR